MKQSHRLRDFPSIISIYPFRHCFPLHYYAIVQSFIFKRDVNRIPHQYNPFLLVLKKLKELKKGSLLGHCL